MALSPKLLSALQKIAETQQAGFERVGARQAQRQEETSTDRLARALEGIGQMNAFQGPKGDKGDTPRRGIDYFTANDVAIFLEEATPVKGKHYRDGIDGEDGVDGKDGKDGIDGKDGNANMEEVEIEIEKEMQKHMKECKHELIHDSKMIGEYELITKDLKVGDILQVAEGKKIVGVDMPKNQTIMMGGGTSTSGRYRIKTVTASYALDPLDQIPHVDASAGNIVISFYAAAGNEGSHVFIKRIDNVLANSVTFTMHGSETIDFETLYQLVNQGSGAEVYTDASNFFIKHT